MRYEIIIVLIIMMTFGSLLNAQVFNNSESIFNVDKPTIYELDTLIPRIVHYLNQENNSCTHIKITKISIFDQFVPVYLTEKFKISTLYNSFPDTFLTISGKIVCLYYSMPPPKRDLKFVEQYDSIIKNFKWDDRILTSKNEEDYGLDRDTYYLDQKNHSFNLAGIYFVGDSLKTIDEHILVYFINHLNKLYCKQNPMNREILDEIMYRNSLED